MADQRGRGEGNSAEDLQQFIDERADETATSYTDDLASYRGLSDHETVNRSAGQYVDGDVHVNGMEGVWSMVKRGYRDTHHHMSPKHMQRYLNEYVARHNMRSVGNEELRMVMTVQAMVGKRLSKKDLVAGHDAYGRGRVGTPRT